MPAMFVNGKFHLSSPEPKVVSTVFLFTNLRERLLKTSRRKSETRWTAIGPDLPDSAQETGFPVKSIKKQSKDELKLREVLA